MQRLKIRVYIYCTYWYTTFLYIFYIDNIIIIIYSLIINLAIQNSLTELYLPSSWLIEHSAVGELLFNSLTKLTGLDNTKRLYQGLDKVLNNWSIAVKIIVKKMILYIFNKVKSSYMYIYIQITPWMNLLCMLMDTWVK